MHDGLLQVLGTPGAGEPLQRQASDLVAADGARWPVVSGIPRFVEVVPAASDQDQTADSFGYKWRRREAWDSEASRARVTRWTLERFGFESIGALREHWSGAEWILDAGCGGGNASGVWLLPDGAPPGAANWVGLDISAAIDVAAELLGGLPRTHFVQGDVTRPPFRHGVFDVIVSDGVLHHTPDTRAALAALVPLLRAGGEICFYVYKTKAPAREFVDDHVRAAIAGLPPEEAWEAMRPLTELGKVLSELDAKVTVPDVPVLGIEGGTYDVQRLIYWNFAKLFWDPNMGFEENLHVNFDWYHPRYAHRQSEADVRGWCEELGLRIERCHPDRAGITVRARRD